jgi:deazaflavin-dependent oxidoreductase (nitroreductase family)
MNEPTALLPRIAAPINRMIGPAIRTGLANPLPLAGGLIILEAVGRATGVTRSTPLLALDYGQVLLVSTVRPDSQWVRNLAASKDAHIWLRGRRRPVTAWVCRNGAALSASQPEGFWQSMAAAWSFATGSSVAVLSLS